MTFVTIAGRDHPRSRGNNCEMTDTYGLVVGSPPLAREQPPHADDRKKAIGITPARAGTTFALQYTEWKDRDHPRSRGNNINLHLLPALGLGSPPLAREQQGTVATAYVQLRITPARAGTTALRKSQKATNEDHPRSRGNNQCNPCAWVAHKGSPPLAREQRILTIRMLQQSRITPARAGTTARFNLCIDQI